MDIDDIFAEAQALAPYQYGIESIGHAQILAPWDAGVRREPEPELEPKPRLRAWRDRIAKLRIKRDRKRARDRAFARKWREDGRRAFADQLGLCVGEVASWRPDDED